MAVTVADLAISLRVITEPTDPINTGLNSRLTRLLGVATERVRHYAPTAPEVSRDEATIVYASYLYDQPSVKTSQYAAAFFNSGADSILSPWHVERAGRVRGETAPTSGPSGTGGTGGTGGQIDSDAVNRLIMAAVFPQALVGNTEAWPANKIPPAGVTTDATARAAAKAADDKATLAQAAATVNAGAIASETAAREQGDRALSTRIDSLGSVGTPADGSVTTSKVADDAITEPKLAPAVRTKLNDRGGGGSSSSGGPLADGSVTTNKIADDAVTARKLAADSVVTGVIADRAVTGIKIAHDAITSEHIPADAITKSELAGASVGTSELVDGSVTEGKLDSRVVAKLTRAIGGGKLLGIVATDSTAKGSLVFSRSSQEAFPNAENGDIVIGYRTGALASGPSRALRPRIAIFRYQTSPSEGFVKIVQVDSRIDYDDLENFIEGIVSSWAIHGSGVDIPGDRTYNGLFGKANESSIPGANVTITFAVGNAGDGDEVDETDAAATNFAIAQGRDSWPDGSIRCRYNLQRITLEGFAPYDIELQLQALDGTIIGKHNIKDEGSGSATFPLPPTSGNYRWAVRIVTKGAYTGDVVITNTVHLQAQALVYPDIEHIVHPIVSDEAEKRQAQDAELRSEITRVEGIKAIVNGLPAATSAVKKSIVWRRDLPYQQADSDAFQVPASGFVSFIVGNLGTTAIMPVRYCRNREEIVYAVGDVSVGLQFSSTGKAALYARKGSAQWASHEDAYNTTNGFVMLHWATARAGETGEGHLSKGTRLNATLGSGRIRTAAGAIASGSNFSTKYISLSNEGTSTDFVTLAGLAEGWLYIVVGEASGFIHTSALLVGQSVNMNLRFNALRGITGAVDKYVFALDSRRRLLVAGTKVDDPVEVRYIPDS